MKLTIFFLITAFLQTGLAGYAQKVTLSGKNVSLEQVFKQIRYQTGYNILCNAELIKDARTVDIELENAPIELALEKILAGQGLTYTIKNNTVVVQRKPIPPQPQAPPGIIKGKVRDSKGITLPGVTVKLESNVTKTTMTDGSGNYTFTNVPPGNYTLSFTYLGFSKAIRAVALKEEQEIVLDINMVEEASKLEEVIVVGYGEVRKSDLTGAISSIKVGDEAKERSVIAASDLIYGKAAGVQIFNNSGVPNSEITFNIRGVSSFSSNQPLIVIDGVPVDAGTWGPSTAAGVQRADLQPNVGYNGLANLNPNEIESIEILKDASSTAIYGSRASNGVVLITTKKGTAGKDKIEYNLNLSNTQVVKKYQVLNSTDYMDFYNEATLNDGGTILPFPEPLYSENAQKSSDWQDLIFRNGVSYDHQLSLSGGSQKSKYAIMGNYSSNEGIILTSTFNKGGVRFNFDREISNKFKIGLRANYAVSKSNAIPQSSTQSATFFSIISSALSFPPFKQAYLDDGDINDEESNNPIVLLKSKIDEYKSQSLISNFTAEYKILDGLYFKFNGGFNNNIDNRDVYHTRATRQGFVAPNGSATIFDTKRKNFLTEYTLNLNRQFGKSRVNALAGYTWQEWSNRNVIISARDFPDDALLYYNLSYANIVDKPKSSYTTFALASFIGRSVYSYDNRYVVTATARYDGSTRLAKENKWSFFPSIGLAWNAHNEKFMGDQNLFSTLKFRGSWGVTGNQSIPPGSSQSTLTSGTAIFDQSLVVGYIPDQFNNPNLRWETTKQWNAGVDIGFVKSDRFSLTADYYSKNTKDQLGSYPLPPSSGFSSFATNLGVIKNYGLELEANANALVKKLKWNITGNITFNKTRIISLGDLEEILTARNISAISLPFMRELPGQSMHMFYGFKVDGVYQNQQEVNAGPVDATRPNTPGDIKFVDLNKDGIIDNQDRTFLGSPFPDYFFGLTNSFSYKGLSLNILVAGSIGQEIANLNRYRLDGLVANNRNISQEAYDGRWTGEGTSNYYPKATLKGEPFKARFTNLILEDGSYVKLKSVVLAYQLPIRQWGIKWAERFKIFASGTNLLILTKYKGYDPEISGLGSSMPGVDIFSAPQGRTFNFGCNVVF